MNRADDKRDDDEAWLEALAGKQTPVPEGRVGLETEALRRALVARRGRLEAQVPKPNEALFERIIGEIEATDNRNVLRGLRDDVFGEQVSKTFLSLSADNNIKDVNRSPDHSGWRTKITPWIWGFATMALATTIAVPIWIGSDREADELVVRSGPNVTVQIVSDPELRAKEISDLLQNSGVKPGIERRKDGTIVLIIDSTPEVLDLLASQRLMPQPKNSKIVIWVEKSKDIRNP